MKTPIHVIIVEDHPEYRDSIRLALETDSSLQCSGAFGSAERALRTLQDTRQRIPVDVILLDLNLPGLSGLDALPFFKTAAPEAKVIILTQSDTKPDILSAIASGAAGYLLKKARLDQITDSIHTVMNQGASLDGGVAQYLLDTLRQHLPSQDLDTMLSARELEILALLAQGQLKKEIASSLGIGVSTVATHIRHIYDKLDVQNAAAAVTRAYEVGILPRRV